MFQRDYILRMIEMMGDLARKIAQLMDELDQMKLLDDKCREYCGMPLQALENLSVDSLCDLLAPQPRFFAAELLYLRARSLCWDRQQELLLRSFRLLTSLREEGPLCEARLKRMQELKSQLLPLLSWQDLLDCAVFFSQAESYGDMEDALFQTLEPFRGCPDPSAAARQGAAMLRQAAQADQRTLILCGMTGHELRVSARELEALAQQEGESQS